MSSQGLFPIPHSPFPVLGVIVSQFPEVHETFIARELAALRDGGKDTGARDGIRFLAPKALELGEGHPSLPDDGAQRAAGDLFMVRHGQGWARERARRWSWMASRIFLSASRCERPWEMHPGREGQVATYTPSSSRSSRTRIYMSLLSLLLINVAQTIAHCQLSRWQGQA